MVLIPKPLKLNEYRLCRIRHERHTFASNQRLAGTDITDLKDLLGHADLSMTMRYAHVTPSHTMRVMERFEEFLQSPAM